MISEKNGFLLSVDIHLVSISWVKYEAEPNTAIPAKSLNAILKSAKKSDFISTGGCSSLYPCDSRSANASGKD